MGVYRLEKIGGELAVIPPPYANRSPGKRVELQIPAAQGMEGRKDRGCSVTEGPFRLLRNSSGWRAVFPSLQMWSQKLTGDASRQQLETFLSRIGTLSSSGCIPASRVIRIQNAVRQAIPSEVYDVLRRRYRYVPSVSFVELEPGMRLTIDRAEYDRSSKFRGTAVVYYRITRNSRAQLRFRRVKVERHGGAPVRPGDLDVSTRFSDDFYIRLFFSGNLVTENVNYAALIVGTRSLKHMAEVTRVLETHPQSGCPKKGISDAGADCESFSGSVTVSAELSIKVNGKKLFVAPGTDVRRVFAEAGETACENNPYALRIERDFMGHPVKIAFNPAADSIMHLTVAVNDRIFCSAASAAHIRQ